MIFRIFIRLITFYIKSKAKDMNLRMKKQLHNL